MASHEDDELAPEDTPNYQPPAPKSVNEILSADADDESLQKYKATLLGGLSGSCVVYPENPKHVIVEKLAILVDGRPDMEVDLTSEQKLKEFSKNGIVLKEGCQYKVKIYFIVQREIVQGLKYVQQTYKAGIRVDKNTFMVGSYGPKMELQSYTTPVEEAPSGLIARGSYTIKSLFTDDDKNEHLKWEWKLEIKKDWEWVEGMEAIGDLPSVLCLCVETGLSEINFDVPMVFYTVCVKIQYNTNFHGSLDRFIAYI